MWRVNYMVCELYLNKAIMKKNLCRNDRGQHNAGKNGFENYRDSFIHLPFTS